MLLSRFDSTWAHLLDHDRFSYNAMSAHAISDERRVVYMDLVQPVWQIDRTLQGFKRLRERVDQIDEVHVCTCNEIMAVQASRHFDAIGCRNTLDFVCEQRQSEAEGPDWLPSIPL